MTVFEETNGVFSMRRILAFFFAILSAVAGILSVYFKLEWQTVAAAFLIPAVACLILLFFTTWQDVTELIKSAKQNQ